jgi:hypothetical protein
MGSSRGFDLPTGDRVESDVSIVLVARCETVRPKAGAFPQ